TWTAAWTGAAGAALLIGLAAAGRAEVGPAVMGALALAVFAAYQTERAGRSRRFERLSYSRAASASPGASEPFGAVFDALPDPTLVISGGELDDLASRRVLFANAAARDLLRIPREGALLVAALRHPEVLEAVDESLFGGLVRTSAWESGGAQDRVWRAWSAPLAPSAPDNPRALLVIHEETDVRRAERTRADFLANASHELRTPLASLAGFIETLRGHAREDVTARDRFLEIMAAQAARMARLVDDLMSLSRIELNEHVPPAGVVDVAMAVVDVSDALAPLARRQDVAIRTEILGERRALITGDRDQILQVVQNLVDNAVKYSPAGATVTVEVRPDLDFDAAGAPLSPGAARISLLTPDRRPDHRYVSIRVADCGPGIEREHLPRLAERFYRVEGQKSGARPGTGLGLAIVKHVVNRHRGGLSVDSTPGQGSTFTVYLPMLDAKIAALVAPARDASPVQSPVLGDSARTPADATKVS
ncbi:MAG: ATP-binding protein, partial [Pseudomonadota bacterium]|nr:ATP-binding protein [Pseudomonadota bacterium]